MNINMNIDMNTNMNIYMIMNMNMNRFDTPKYFYNICLITLILTLSNTKIVLNVNIVSNPVLGLEANSPTIFFSISI
jgi:hypothetical protein